MCFWGFRRILRGCTVFHLAVFACLANCSAFLLFCFGKVLMIQVLLMPPHAREWRCSLLISSKIRSRIMKHDDRVGSRLRASEDLT